MGEKCAKLVCPGIWSFIGFALIIGSGVIIGLGTIDQLITNMVNKELVISLDSAAFSQWMDPTPPIYMQYWFFNVTNPKDVVNGKKAIVKEVGPLTYRMLQPRTNVAFFTNDTVMYKYNHTLVYQKSLSAVEPTQAITQLNLPLITVDTMLKQQNLPKLVEDMVKELVKKWGDSSLFVKHTMEEFLYGYDDPIFTKLHKYVPDQIPAQFGLFYQFNNSDDGVYLANTGRKDISKVNVLQRWNYNTSLSWWGTKEANMINGTDGTFMSSGISKNDTLYIYTSDACRSLYLVFERETKVRGIETWRFRVPDEVFESPLTNKDNIGFCLGYPDNCLKNGVLEIGVCKQGAPVVLSCPHFYMADQSYVDGVTGLHPNKTFHETFLDIEPMTGAVFSANKRLQMNVLLKPSSLFTEMKALNETIFPVAWLNESVVLDADTSDTFKSEVLRTINIVTDLPYAVLGVGIIVLLITLLVIACNSCLKKDPYKSLETSTVSSVDI